MFLPLIKKSLSPSIHSLHLFFVGHICALYFFNQAHGSLLSFRLSSPKTGLLGMALAFTSLYCWLRGTKNHEGCNAALHSSSDLPSVLRELDSVKFLSMNGPKMRSSSRRVKRKWQSREERRIRIDREYDMVIVPSDGGCFSGSESDDSDWSVGWIEPHASDFQSNNSDNESSFAVLVPCYSHGRCEKMGNLNSYTSGADQAANQQTGFSFEDDDYIERWLSTIQNV